MTIFSLSALALLSSSAFAAAPNADRPSVSRSGFLVADDTLEMETGLAFQNRTTTVPSTLKYSIKGIVEPRLSADFSGFDTGNPALDAAAKIRLISTDDLGLALYAGSAVPLGGEEWVGTFQALATIPFESGVSLQFNGGLLFVEQGYAGIPLVGAFGFPIFGNFSGFVEVAVVLADAQCGNGCPASNGIVDGGLAWGLTEILSLDTGIGYDIDNGQLFGAAGLTANFGSFR